MLLRRSSALVLIVAATTAGSSRAAADKAPLPVPACQRKHPNVRVIPAGPAQGSTVGLMEWAGTTTALVADEDDAVVHTIDVTNAKRSVTPLAGTPSQLLVLPDGRVAVALRDKNRVQLLEPTADPRAPLSSLCEIDVAAEPVGLAATPDRLVVTSGWGHSLTVVDLKTVQRSRVITLPREPRGVLVDDAGKRAFVSHVVGGALSVVDLAGAEANGTARTVSLGVTKKPPFTSSPISQKGAQGFALARSESRVYSPMAVADPGDQQQTTSSGYGSGRPGPSELPFVGVVDTKSEEALVTEITGEDFHRSRECLLPRAAAYLGERRSLLVACMGIDMLVELDASTKEPARKERSRWRVGAGPTGIAVDAKEHRAVVWSQFDHAVTIVSLDAPEKGRAAPAPTRIDIGRRTSMSAELARGRVLFHKTDDLRLSRDGRACASCHPDGRDDALTWSTPSGPRQTIMLAGRTDATAPYSWSGTNATIAEHVTGTFQRLGGLGLASGEADDLRSLLTYVAALKTPAHRPPRDAQVIARGRTVFNSKEQDCGGCHVDGAGTDGQKHQVGSTTDAPFDTPSLRFVGGTAPYFHDGRFATLDEMLTSTTHQMGNVRQLSASDRQALIAYLETL